MGDFAPFWRDVLSCSPYAMEANGFPPPLHFHPTSYPARAAIQHPLSGQERPLYRREGGGPPFRGSHEEGSTLSSSSFLYQLHLPHSQEDWWHEAHPELEEVECCPPGHPVLPHGDGRGCAPRPQTRRLGGIHRPTGRIFSWPVAPLHQKVHAVRMEGQTLAVLRAPLRTFSSPEGLHIPRPIYQGEF
jgi:hypothetical protein